MPDNGHVSEGLEVAAFYYSAKRYFHQLAQLTEGVGRIMQDQGWKITSWDRGRPALLGHWSWKDHQCSLPKLYATTFEPDPQQNAANVEKYGMSLWFFNLDPQGRARWVPSGYFFRLAIREDGKYQPWLIDPCIAEFVRLRVLDEANLEEDRANVYVQLEHPWPQPLAAQPTFERNIEYIDIVPFPLAAINTSDDLEFILHRAVSALEQRNADVLWNDLEYMQKVWPEPLDGH